MKSFSFSVPIFNVAASQALPDSLLVIVTPATAAIILRRLAVRTQENTSQQLRFGIFLITTPGTPAGNQTGVIEPHPLAGSVSKITTILGDITTEPTTWRTNSIFQDMQPSVSGFKLPIDQPVGVPPSRGLGVRLLGPTGYSAFNALIEGMWDEISDG